MHILLLGASLDSLLLSLHLQSKGHLVTIVEIEAEVGLPLHHPGRIINIDLVSDYFSNNQIEFLSLQENEDGWGCRWEWVLKHMAHRVVQQNVTCMLRTRVLNIGSNGDGFHVTVSSNERDLPTEFTVDHIINMQPKGYQTPGNRSHEYPPSFVQEYPYPNVEPWVGGIVLSSTLQQHVEADLLLKHADGLAELWWKGTPSWTPPNGFIETCELHLPSDIDEVSFDAVVRRVASFAQDIV
jgi:hypothetical protein